MKYNLAMMGLIAVVCAGCAGTLKPAGPQLTQDARLILDPNKLPHGKDATPEEGAKEMAEVCARPGFQCTYDPVDVSLIKPDGSLYHQNVSPPIMTLQNDASISILSGQTLYVEADVVDGKLVHMKLVPAVVHPEKTVSISLEQRSGSDGKPMMFLKVRNPFDKPLRYHAGMMVLDGPDGAIYATDTCPVRPKIFGGEFWPMPIFQIFMSGLTLLDADAKSDCGY